MIESQFNFDSINEIILCKNDFCSHFKVCNRKFAEFLLCRSFKILRRIPNPRDQDYFYSYENAEFTKIAWYQQLFNFISRCLYFITGPKVVVPILGLVRETPDETKNSRSGFFRSRRSRSRGWKHVWTGPSPVRVSGIPGHNLLSEVLPVSIC